MVRRFGEGGEKQSCPGRYKKELPGDEKVLEIQKGKAEKELPGDEKVLEIQKGNADLVVSINPGRCKKQLPGDEKVLEIQEGGDEKATKTKQKFGKPVTFCETSSRWRDARGRYCRPPSPAAPASFAR